MTNRRRGLLLTLFMLILLSASKLTLAQDAASLLVVYDGGDFYTWDGQDASVRPLTHDGGRLHPVRSPDGTRIAYLAYPPATKDDASRSGNAASTDALIPVDVRVLDLASGREETLAAQPLITIASRLLNGGAVRTLARSQPVWSPDADEDQLAWIEYPVEEPNTAVTAKVVVYDFATHKATVLVDDVLVPPMASRPVLIWSSNMVVIQIDERDTTYPYFIDFTDYGYWLKSNGFKTAQTERPVASITAERDGSTLIETVYANGHWDEFDVITGGTASPAFLPELHLLNEPDGALYGAPLIGQDGNLLLQLYDAARSPVGDLMPVGREERQDGMLVPMDQVAFSPDGRTVASIKDGTITFLGDSQVGQLTGIDGSRAPQELLWGTTQWRFTPDDDRFCPLFSLSELSLGQNGRGVGDAGANTLRAGASLRSPILEIMPNAAEFSVLAGPQCADNLIWWQINDQGVVGWAAEVKGELYEISPARRFLEYGYG